MAMFVCVICEELRDSADGAEEESNIGYRSGLICQACIDNRTDEELAQRELGLSYDAIYEGLVKAGCPEDIARELAREKGK